MTITVTRELDFNDLMDECWSGAIDTLNTVAENNKEEELMSILALDCFVGGTPDLTDVNDLLWFEDDWIFEMLGIKEEEEEEEEDDDEEEAE